MVELAWGNWGGGMRMDGWMLVCFPNISIFSGIASLKMEMEMMLMRQ